MTAVSLESLRVCTFSSEGPLELHLHTHCTSQTLYWRGTSALSKPFNEGRSDRRAMCVFLKVLNLGAVQKPEGSLFPD